MVDVPKETSFRTNERDKRYMYELLEFKEYNTFFPTPEEEVMGLDFLLAEPSCNDGLVEPFLGVTSVNSQKCYVTDDKCDHNNGSKNFDLTWRREEQRKEDNYGQVQVTDEGILQEMNNLPSICEDYLFASRGNSCNVVPEMFSKSSKMSCDLASGDGRGCKSSIYLSNKKTKPAIASYGKETLLCDSIVLLSSVDDDGSLQWRDSDACFTQKRPRKRPSRYIDEYSKYHPVRSSKRPGSLSENFKQKTEFSELQYQDYMKEDVRERKLVHHNEYITEAIQVPFGPSLLECSERKESLLPGRDPANCSKAIIKISEEKAITELSLAPSQDDMSYDNDLGEVAKDKSWRKHNKYWSEHEIAKLIEGVAEYGVGRWTEIKRGFFPPSTRRTSVDLKDKWRNLLKACTAQLRIKNEGRRVAHQQVPQSVLKQVKELSIMHPYPKIPSPKNDLVVKC